MFSKSCEYAIKAAIYIAESSLQNKKVGFVAIAAAISSPEAFTAKILQKLSKSGIIESSRGVNGGFYISKEAVSTVKLAKIVSTFDGNSVFKGCGLGLEKCNEIHPCPLHEKFMSIRSDLSQMLETTNLEELALGLKSGTTFLKIEVLLMPDN